MQDELGNICEAEATPHRKGKLEVCVFRKAQGESENWSFGIS